MRIEGIINEDGDRCKDKIVANLILYTSFMNESEMKEGQRTAIFKEHCEKWTQMAGDFLKEAKDGVVTLTLEP